MRRSPFHVHSADAPAARASRTEASQLDLPGMTVTVHSTGIGGIPFPRADVSCWTAMTLAEAHS